MILNRLMGLLRSSVAFPQIDRLIVGLGNPGLRYVGTRHNAGFMVLDSVIRKTVGVSHYYKYDADIMVGRVGEVPKVALVKPQTFMNRSGVAARSLLVRTRVCLPAVLVVSDDFNLPLGSIRFRRGGADGGHKGLKSISEHVGQEFPRLRIGIGPLPKGESVMDFVLSPFSETQEQALAPALDRACEGVVHFVANGIESSMNRYN